MEKDYGRQVPSFEVDVRRRDQVDAMVRATAGASRIDVLLTTPVSTARLNAEMSDETWDLVLGVCLTGPSTSRASCPT